MTDSERLVIYCPDADYLFTVQTMTILDHHRTDLIANALIRRIKERGEWEEFFAYCKSEWNPDSVIVDSYSRMFAWLTDPSTLIRVAGEWVKSKGD